MEIRTFKAEIRSVGSKIIGRIPYNSESLDLGGFKEILKPGCFSESLRSKEAILVFGIMIRADLWAARQMVP